MLYEDGLLHGLVLHSPMAILDCLQSGVAAPGKFSCMPDISFDCVDIATRFKKLNTNITDCPKVAKQSNLLTWDVDFDTEIPNYRIFKH